MDNSLSEYDERGEPVEGYRQLSGWSILAIAAAFLSPLVLVQPGFVVFPFVSVAAASVVLMRSSRGHRLSAVAVTRFALAWALLFLSAGVSSFYWTRQFWRHRAIENVNYWLGLALDQQMNEAYLLTQTMFSRPFLKDSKLVTQAAGPKQASLNTTSVETFEDSDMMKKLAAAKYQGHFEFRRVDRMQTVAGERYFWLLYQFRPDATTEVKPFFVLIRIDQVEGSRPDKRFWRIAEWDVHGG